MSRSASMPDGVPMDRRLVRFERDARGGADTARAWKALTRSGVPLIGPTAPPSHDRLVTFLWRPTRPIGAASLYSPIAEFSREGTALAPLGDTGVWYRTYRLPATARASYGFAPRPLPSLTDPGRAWGEFVRSLGPDPLNPRRVKAGPRLFLSEFELPDATAEPWLRSRGGLGWREERRRLRSRKLGNARAIWVELPPRFDPRRSDYNLLVVFDGPAYQDPIPTRRIVTNLVAAGRIDPTVVVLLDNAPDARERDLGGRAEFAEFLADELLPWLARRYGVRSESRRTVLAGSSMGGLAAAHAALEHPERFGAVLAQSGAFLAMTDAAGGSLMDRYAERERLNVRFWLNAGTHETIVPPGGSMSLLDGVRRMRDVLRAKEYPVSYTEFEGGHDYAWWRATLADGLIYLLGRARGPRRHRSNRNGRASGPGRGRRRTKPSHPRRRTS